MAFAGKLLRGALMHTRSSGVLFPGAAATGRACLVRPITTSNLLRSDDKALTENEEKRVAIIGKSWFRRDQLQRGTVHFIPTRV